MKIGIGLIILTLAGCATEPLTFDQRMQLMHAAQQQPHYYLPQPTPLYVPQTHVITCTRSDGTTYTCQ